MAVVIARNQPQMPPFSSPFPKAPEFQRSSSGVGPSLPAGQFGPAHRSVDQLLVPPVAHSVARIHELVLVTPRPRSVGRVRESQGSSGHMQCHPGRSPAYRPAAVAGAPKREAKPGEKFSAADWTLGPSCPPRCGLRTGLHL